MIRSWRVARRRAVVLAAAVLAACGGAIEEEGPSVASSSSPLCSSATLTATQAGATVSLAAGSGCASTPEYRFFVRVPGAAGYTPLSEYGPSATFAWDVTGQPAGLYQFLVYVREVGSAAPYESFVTTTRLVGSVCTAAALSVSGGAGATVNLAASATCSAGATPEYRFLIRAPGAAYTEVRPYAAAATFAWDGAGWPAGRYDLLVYARAAGNASAYEATATETRLLGAACTSATLTATPGADGNVALAASAVCTGGAAPEYRFLFRAPGGAGFTELRAYGTTSTHAWDTTGLPAGKYELVAYTRAAGNASSYEALGTTTAMVGAVCTSAAVTATVRAGGVLDLAATAVCAGGGTPEYRFMVRPPGAGTLAELRPYSTTSTFAASTAGLASGLYELIVLVRTAGNASPYEAFAATTRMIGSVCSAATLTVTPGAGGLVTLDAAATCAEGAVPEYRFLVRPPGATALVELRPYGGAAQHVLSTSGVAPGTYTLVVYARAAGNTSQYEAAAARSHTVP